MVLKWYNSRDKQILAKSIHKITFETKSFKVSTPVSAASDPPEVRILLKPSWMTSSKAFILSSIWSKAKQKQESHKFIKTAGTDIVDLIFHKIILTNSSINKLNKYKSKSSFTENIVFTHSMLTLKTTPHHLTAIHDFWTIKK